MKGLFLKNKIIQGLKKISEKCLVMLGQSAGINTNNHPISK
jgi:hypothetical protein